MKIKFFSILFFFFYFQNVSGQIFDTITICNGDSAYIFNNWETATGNYTNSAGVTTLVVNPSPTLTGNFILNGNAAQPIPNTYQLTQAFYNQSGSAWNSVTLNLTQPFTFDVDMFFGYNNGGADGIAFLLQQVSANVGSSGGGIGYQGISPSFCVEFDTWQNGTTNADPYYDHIAVQKNGNLIHTSLDNLVSPIGFPPGNINIEDGQWHNAVFSWDPSTFNFTVVFDGTLLVNHNNDIVANIFGNNPYVYWGFTAATGGANNLQQFRVNSLETQLSDYTICQDDTVQINPQINTPLYTYLWLPNYNITNNAASTTSFFPDSTTLYSLEITNSYGCFFTDSLTIFVNAPTSIDNVGAHCDSYTWVDGITYTASNNSATWTTFDPITGCDNVATLNLTINNSTTSIDNVGAHCDSYTWVDGITYTASNNSATWTTFDPITGCDNVATLNLTINNSTTSIDNVGTHCGAYTWVDGITYNVSNNSATWTTINPITGCDNVAALNLIINNSTTSIDNVGAHCDSYTWIDGITYTASNNSATWTITDPVTGCDNIAALNLIINNSTTSIDNVGAHCDSYTWIDGITYTASNNSATWTTIDPITGCDNIAALNLIINNSTTSIDNVGAHCDSYTWIDGVTYTVSNNTATWVTTNTMGCDNVETLNLTINYSTSNTTLINACNTYTWSVNNQTFTSSGIYTDISTNTAGCSHTEILDLVVGYTDDIDLLIEQTNISCFGYDDGSIILNAIGGTPPYQYLWGNGSTNQSIISLPAGDYPFSVTDANGCSTNSIATITQSEEIFLDFIATSPICRYDESTLSIHISNSNFNSYTVSLQDSILKSYTIDTNGLLIATGLPIILTPNFSCDPVIISLTDEYGCTAVVNDNVHIEVKQLPVLAVNEPDICIGTPSFTLVNATPTGGSYKIEGVSTDFFDASNLNPGNYNISYSYTDLITSCSNQIADIITISDSPKAGMIFSPQPANISDPNIYFRDNSNEEVLISEWDLGDGTIIYDDLSFWHTYDDIGSYTIRYYITNLYGCTDSVVEKLNINPNYSTFIPNSFTPNNDGDNDVFFPNSVGYKTYNIKIFDRWGGIIYDEDDLAWDGNNNGKIIGGLYSYTINILDFKDKPFIYTGLVNLIR